MKCFLSESSREVHLILGILLAAEGMGNFVFPHHPESEVAQPCPTLCNPVDCSLPGSSVQEILQAGILEWVAMLSSRGHSLPRDQTSISLSPTLEVGIFTTSTTWEALEKQ